MRRFLTLCALGCAVVIVAASADGQVPQFQGAGPERLLGNRAVQEELKFSDEQKTRFTDLRKSIGAKMKEGMEAMKDLPKEEQGQMLQKLFKETRETMEKEVKEILSAEQAKRLKQIDWQQNIPATLANVEEAQKALSMPAEQIAEAKKINDESLKDIAQLYQQDFKKKGNPRETLEKVSVLQKEANTKASKLLSDEQKDKWKKLVGAPFEVKFEGFGFGKKN